MTNTGAFQAIVRKEMREHIAWAVLGLMLTFVMLISRLPSDRLEPTNWVVFGITVVTAVVGLMLGRAVVISENRGDSWGFLVHRPVSRSTVFWGKAVAGLLLYFGAVAIPTLIVAGWLAMPGRFVPPFDWLMTLTAVADISCGVVFFFAGMLANMRDARWYASRGLGVGVGVICGILIVNTFHSFWSAMACCAVGTLVAATAARGTFLTGGSYSPQSRISRMAVGLSIASGLAVTYIFVFLAVALFSSPNRQTASMSAEFALSKDGSIVKVVSSNHIFLEADDLQGNPIDKYKDDAERNSMSDGVRAVTAYMDPEQRGVPATNDTGYRSTFAIYTALESKDVYSSFSHISEFRWYFIHRLGLIAGYDPRTRRLIGWLGPDGYSPGEAPPSSRFSGELRSVNSQGPLIAFTDAVYRVDINTRSVSKVFTASAGESITGAGASWGIVIATTKKVYVQSMDGKLDLAIPRDPQAAAYGTVQFLEAQNAPGQPMFVWYFAGKSIDHSDTLAMPQYVTPVHSDGSLGARVTLPALVTPEMQAGNPDGDIGIAMLNRPLKAVITMNMFLLGLYGILGSSLMGRNWISVAGVFTAGLMIAGIIFVKGRRNAFTSGQLLTWTFLGFVLGPLGLALMYSLIEWPAKEVCPSCKRRRIVSRERCEHCGDSFAQPQADGTEIFEPLTLP